MPKKSDSPDRRSVSQYSDDELVAAMVEEMTTLEMPIGCM